MENRDIWEKEILEMYEHAFGHSKSVRKAQKTQAARH